MPLNVSPLNVIGDHGRPKSPSRVDRLIYEEFVLLTGLRLRYALLGGFVPGGLWILYGVHWALEGRENPGDISRSLRQMVGGETLVRGAKIKQLQDVPSAKLMPKSRFHRPARCYRLAKVYVGDRPVPVHAGALEGSLWASHRPSGQPAFHLVDLVAVEPAEDLIGRSFIRRVGASEGGAT